MKKTILSLLITVGLIGSASAQVLSGDLANGLVAYYGFNGNLNDSSSIGNNIIDATEGIIFGPNRFGKTNGSIFFSSVTDSAQSLYPIGISGNSPRTFSLWVNNQGVPNNVGALFGFGIDPRSSSLDGVICQFQINNSEYANSLYLGGAIDMWGGYADSAAFNMHYIENAWHMITYVYNGSISSAEFYIDGQSINGDYHRPPIAVGSENRTNALSTVNTELHIGTFVGVGAMLNTSISDLGIWDTALSSSQVSSLYTLQSAPEPSTYALFGIGAIGLLMVVRRKKTA